MMAAFGGDGVYATNPDELSKAVRVHWLRADRRWSMLSLMKMQALKVAVLATLTRKVLSQRNRPVTEPSQTGDMK